MKVLVIPEDFRKDQFILQPIIEAMFTKLRRPALVEVLRDPLIMGISRALDRDVLGEIVQDNRWKVDLFLLCVDRDAESGRRNVLDAIEARRLEDEPGGGRKTLGHEAARNYRRIHSRCREDIQVLGRRISTWVQEGRLLSWDEASRAL
jgi:hypothetical protein